MKNIMATAALAAFVFTAESASAAPVCGDVNDTGSVTAADALAVLKKAVGQPIGLTCDQCGSSCVGDPRYLLGEWIFESDFDGNIYEDSYDLFAVDELNCEIVGQDLDDYGIVYGYVGDTFDYVLLDENQTYCDLFVFDYVGPDEVVGYDLPYDLDADGYCDFDAPFVEGTMIGDRVGSLLATASSPRQAAVGSERRPSKAAARTTTLGSAAELAPELVPLIERVRSLYARHRPRSHR